MQLQNIIIARLSVRLFKSFSFSPLSCVILVCAGLTHAVPPEVPRTASVPSSQDVDVSVAAAAGVLVAVPGGLTALGKLSPEGRAILTHGRHCGPASVDWFLQHRTWKCSENLFLFILKIG